MNEEQIKDFEAQFKELDAATADFDPKWDQSDICTWWCEKGKPAIEEIMEKWWWRLIPKKIRDFIEAVVTALNKLCDCS